MDEIEVVAGLDGTFAVLDRVTGHAVILDGMLLIGLPAETARDYAEVFRARSFDTWKRQSQKCH
jgi:hypothetical protein